MSLEPTQASTFRNHTRHMTESAPTSTRWLAAGTLIALLSLLYIIPAVSSGWWEPGETSMIRWAEALEDGVGGSFLSATLDEQPLYRPWLMLLAAKFGWAMAPGVEWAPRVPGILLLLAGSLALMSSLWRFAGPRRSMLAGLMVGAAPLALVSSAHLSGFALPLGALTLALAAWINALINPPNTRDTLLASIATALTFWAGGAILLSATLAALAGLALSSPATQRAKTTDLVPGVALIVAVLLSTYALRLGGASVDSQVVTLALGLPAGALLIAAPSSTLSDRLSLRALAVMSGVIALLALAPLALAVSAHGGEAFAQVWRYSITTEATLGSSITFDVVLRIATFTFFPLCALVPMAFAWAWKKTTEPAPDPADPTGTVARLLMAFTGAPFALAALTAEASSQPVALVAPAAITAIILAITDRDWLASLRREQVTAGLIGLVSLFSLVMVSRDVRGTHNMDLGRPGPQVIFEPFLLDGSASFPTDYIFRGMSLFVLLWAILIIVPLLNPHQRVYDQLGRWTQTPSKWRVIRWAQAPLRLARRLCTPLQAPIERVFGFWPLLLVISAVAWSAEVATTSLPTIVRSYTQADVFRAWRAQEGDAPLHVVGIRAAERGWYLDSRRTTELENAERAAEVLCGDEVAFIAIERDSLAQLHHSVRQLVDDDTPCGDKGRPIVLTPADDNYLLVSNRELFADGQREDNPIADNLFTEDTIPDDAVRPETEWVANSRLRLVASRITPTRLRRGYVEIETWWEVLRPIRGDWEIFIHADTRGGRLNGDHLPVGGNFPIKYWSVGEIVRDSHKLRVSSTSTRAGVYTAHFGFFRGERRMTFVPEAADNRVPVGTFEVPTLSDALRRSR